MLTNFKELENYVLSQNMKKRIALANAHDEPALSAVVNARRKGVVEGTLVGKKDEIIAMLREMGESEKDYEIVDFDGEELEAAKIAVQLVREGKADIPMKGILQTSNFARAILNKETGLIPAGGRRLVSQCGIFEYEGRFVMITDAAINIAPDVETQIGIVENALPVARALGIDCPKVAVQSAYLRAGGGAMSIGKRIMSIRKERQLTQEQFGSLFHVTRQTVSNWENGVSQS